MNASHHIYSSPTLYAVYATFGAWNWSSYATTEDNAWDLLCRWTDETATDPSGNGDLQYVTPSYAQIRKIR